MTESRQVARRQAFQHFYVNVNSDYRTRTRRNTEAFTIPRRARRRIARVKAKAFLRERRER